MSVAVPEIFLSAVTTFQGEPVSDEAYLTFGEDGEDGEITVTGLNAQSVATMIHALPEMMSALKAVEGASDIGSMHEAFMQTRKAIAKAEGRS